MPKIYCPKKNRLNIVFTYYRKIQKPTEALDSLWLHKYDPEVAKFVESYPNDQNGKWEMYFDSNIIDKKWKQAVKLYREGKLYGVQHIKVSTVAKCDTDSTKKVIQFFCGPKKDSKHVHTVGYNLLHRISYKSERGIMYYKSDQQSSKEENNANSRFIF